MLRFIVLCLFSVQLVPASGYGQSTLYQSLQRVKTVADAQQFMEDYPSLHPSLDVLRSFSDTSVVDRQLFSMKPGQVTSIGDSTYLIISDTASHAYRASYIYLNGSQLSATTIERTRKLILQRYAGGTSFEQLADTYNMDPDKKHGDLGYFAAGLMHAPFEEAVRSHAIGDVFSVDIAYMQWYYVVKKTAPDLATREITVLRVKGR